ncbi:MAG: hypothetical protein IT335_06515 [Thermomicrobiales bacterium]|nr:hypothetical protein [Thermomicrobiales bacterium]
MTRSAAADGLIRTQGVGGLVVDREASVGGLPPFGFAVPADVARSTALPGFAVDTVEVLRALATGTAIAVLQAFRNVAFSPIAHEARAAIAVIATALVLFQTSCADGGSLRLAEAAEPFTALAGIQIAGGARSPARRTDAAARHTEAAFKLAVTRVVRAVAPTIAIAAFLAAHPSRVLSHRHGEAATVHAPFADLVATGILVEVEGLAEIVPALDARLVMAVHPDAIVDRAALEGWVVTMVVPARTANQPWLPLTADIDRIAGKGRIAGRIGIAIADASETLGRIIRAFAVRAALVLTDADRSSR